jgi:hypothetical protein
MDELSELLAALAQTPSAVEDRGYQLIKTSYESPIADYKNIASHRKAYAHIPVDHIDWRYEDQLALWQRMKAFTPEFNFPEQATGDERVYHRRNDFFCDIDGFALYTILRDLKPKQLIEIGSGYSTKLISAAMEKNGAKGDQITCIEPYRAAVIRSLNVTCHQTPLEDLDLSMFDRLGYGDVLFVDSSHVVKPYGDVMLIFTHILPRLAPGVWVHFHDIFLPFDYPESWMVAQRRAYCEQYLLSAFMANNSAWEVKFAVNYFVNRMGVANVQREAGLLHQDGGSFWIRRR